MAHLTPGDLAPDFTLTAHTGATVALRSVLASGRRVVLTFHPASFTGG